MMKVNFAVVMSDQFRCSRRTLQAVWRDLKYYSDHKPTLPVSDNAEIILKEIRRQLRSYEPELVMGEKKEARFCIGFTVERFSVLPEILAHFERLKKIARLTQEEVRATIKMEERWAELFRGESDKFRRAMHWADRDAQQCEKFYDLMIDALEQAKEKARAADEV